MSSGSSEKPARVPKRPRIPHFWRYLGSYTGPWWHLSPGQRGELPVLTPGRGRISGTLRECANCHCAWVEAQLYFEGQDGERGFYRWFHFYGVDTESLAPMREPSCEVLSRESKVSVDERDEAPVLTDASPTAP